MSLRSNTGQASSFILKTAHVVAEMMSNRGVVLMPDWTFFTSQYAFTCVEF